MCRLILKNIYKLTILKKLKSNYKKKEFVELPFIFINKSLKILKKK